MLTKSAEIQNLINAKNAEIDAEAQKAESTDHGKIIQLRNEISILEMQLSDAKAEETQAQDAQVQQQAQVAQTDGLKETIRSIRDAVYLKELMDRALGITENATATQDFNSMVDQAVDEDQTALYTAFNTQLEQRDEKYRLLTLQALNVQKQLDEAKLLIESQAEELITLDKEIEDHKNTLSIAVDELAAKDAEIQRLKDREFDLQQQLANVQTKPQIIDITPTAPSESLADKIAQAKVASIKQFSNLYSEVTYTDSTKEVVHNSQIPSLPIPELPTAIAVVSQNVEQSADNQANAVNHFPSDNVQTSDNGGIQSDVRNETENQMVDKAAEETLTLESLKAEINALKSAHEITALTVARIAEKANLPIAV